MNNKMLRAKLFLIRHRDAYLWTCGVITGACVTFCVMHDDK